MRETVGRLTLVPKRPATEVNEALLRFGTTRKRDLLLGVAESQHIKRVLAACNGSRSFAAELLGIPRRTLQRKLARLRIR
jgi:DNA-binding NtrC family response regulator